MPFNEEVISLFHENKDELEIFSKSKNRIEQKLNTLGEYPIEERKNYALGWLFEELASEEMTERKSETDVQKAVRQIIEDIFQNFDKITNKKNNKPDYVSVVFDNQGQLVIDEVVEFKTSAGAFEVKRKFQPQNSIYTINSVVDLLNNIRKAKSLDEIGQFNKANDEGKKIITDVFNRIQELKLTDQIKLSQNLVYHVVTPKNEQVHDQYLELNLRNKKITSKFTQSNFTHKNCTDILDHYSETN